MKLILSPALLLVIFVSNIFAQDTTARRVFTADDYARAEKMLNYNTGPLVDRSYVRPTFLTDGRFWYRAFTPTGSEYVLVNPADGSKKSGTTPGELGITPAPAPTGFGRRGGGGPEVVSPDGRLSAYIKDWNLWVRDVASGKETQLTTDGVKDFGYATDNAGWRKSDRPIVLWSPDSKRIATF